MRSRLGSNSFLIPLYYPYVTPTGLLPCIQCGLFNPSHFCCTAIAYIYVLLSLFERLHGKKRVCGVVVDAQINMLFAFFTVSEHGAGCNINGHDKLRRKFLHLPIEIGKVDGRRRGAFYPHSFAHAFERVKKRHSASIAVGVGVAVTNQQNILCGFEPLRTSLGVNSHVKTPPIV